MPLHGLSTPSASMTYVQVSEEGDLTMPDKRAVQEVQTMIDEDTLAADTPFGVTTPDFKGLLRVKHRGQHHMFCVSDHADELKQRMLVYTMFKRWIMKRGSTPPWSFRTGTV